MTNQRTYQTTQGWMYLRWITNPSMRKMHSRIIMPRALATTMFRDKVATNRKTEMPTWWMRKRHARYMKNLHSRVTRIRI